MPGAVDIADRLLEIAQFLSTSDHRHAAWFAEAVALSRSGVRFEESLGLAHGYDAVLRQRAQDDALRGLAAQCAASSFNAMAKRIAHELKHYRAHSWLRDQAAVRPTAAPANLLFDYLQAGGPSSCERIRKLLPGLVTNPADMTNPTGV